MKIKNILAISTLSFALVACSSTETKSTSNLSKENTNISQIQTGNFISDVYDPWEPFNRRMYYFNYQVERLVVSPVINTYKFITPDFVEHRVTNFFKNIKVLNTLANSTLQMKGRKSMRALGRLTINTILGLGGIFDVASKMGMPKPYEDFGLTLSHYGVKRGPFLVLPFFGPTNLRDTVGLGGDALILRELDPYDKMGLFDTDSPALMTLRGIDLRKNVPFNYYQTNSPFEYEYVRYLYGQYRGLQEAASENKEKY